MVIQSDASSAARPDERHRGLMSQGLLNPAQGAARDHPRKSNARYYFCKVVSAVSERPIVRPGAPAASK
jgi:hypothetical protein